ncbi:MAG: glycosyl transferase [Pseudomonadales bacterium]|jgi:predicted LPLAT superfamily acyltransferase|nr:glycosyl transferase [Pseudomonadales bacterium]
MNPPAKHWARRSERGSAVLMRLMAWAVRRLGRKWLAPLLKLIVLYFYATDGGSRRAIAEYQRRLSEYTGRADLFPRQRPVFRQYEAFAEAMLDKLDAWQGKITPDSLDIEVPEALRPPVRMERGQVVVCAHFGNLELCRAMAEHVNGLRMNVLVHSYNAVRFNRLLEDSGARSLNLIQVSELDVATMLQLRQRLEQGEWIVITADRAALQGDRVVKVDFLGAKAYLPQGPWLLAGLLRCPVNTLFCFRRGQRYQVSIRPLSEGVAWNRVGREAEIAYWARRYAEVLEQMCEQAPLQWFNFFPFWTEHA